MTTFSLCPFFNELDVLEIRLATLDPVVDVHVIAESTVTYSGDPKPLHFLEHEERFAPWRDKIRYVVVDDMPDGREEVMPHASFHPADSPRWARENHQRDALHRGCHDLRQDDLVYLSDCDEITTPTAFQMAQDLIDQGFEGWNHYLPQHVMYLNWRWHEPATIAIARFVPGGLINELGPQGARELESRQSLLLGDAAGRRELLRTDWLDGWHLSYMGGPEMIAHKIRSAAHVELDQDSFTDPYSIDLRMRYGIDMFDRAERRCRWVQDHRLPDHVLENRERFEHLLIEDPGT